MGSIFQDFRFALRTLRHRPGASAVIVLTLAIGIGINASFFSAFYAMTLRPLPFAEPENLASVFHSRSATGKTWIPVGEAAYLEFSETGQPFDAVGAYVFGSVNLRGEDLPERIEGIRVTPSLFPMLGIEPAMGRLFGEEDGRPGAPGVTLLSHDLWQRSFGGDPEILGRIVHLDGRPHEVVGVMEERFAFPLWHEIWTPLQLDRAGARHGVGELQMVGRLPEGMDLAAASSALGASLARLENDFPEDYEGLGMHLRTLHSSWMPPATQVAGIVMQCLVSLVLLIVCANVANMVLAQANTRRQEMALRAALGASRERLVRQSLVESLLLSTIGGGLGLLLASWQSAWTNKLSAVPIPYWLEMSFDSRAALYALALMVLTAFGIGLMPALRSTALDLSQAIASGGRSDGGSSTNDSRLRTTLVVAEYALAVVILVGALLMLRSYERLRHDDPGFAVGERMTLTASLRGGDFATAEKLTYLDRAERHLETVPELDSVAVSSFAPIGQGGYFSSDLEVRDRHFEEGRVPQATIQSVSHRYFETLRIPLRSGRLFERTDLDLADTGGVEGGAIAGEANHPAVIDISLAEHLWPGEDAIGRQLRRSVQAGASPGSEGEPWLTVVGVVGSVDPGKPLAGVDGRPPHQVYVPLSYLPDSLLGSSPIFVVASSADPLHLGPHLRRHLATVDARVPIYDVFTMAHNMRRYYFAQHIWSRMFALIAFAALSIAAVGAYGVSAYAVSRRRREMGIRIALGASPRNLRLKVVAQNVGVAAIGLGLGLLMAWPMAKVMSTILHGVGMGDPLVLGGVLGLLALVSFLASYGPARSASNVDPIRVLREE